MKGIVKKSVVKCIQVDIRKVLLKKFCVDGFKKILGLRRIGKGVSEHSLKEQTIASVSIAITAWKQSCYLSV